MKRVWARDGPPPGPGFTTLMAGLPSSARLVAGIATCSCVLLMKVVGRAAPFHCTTELLLKFVPFTVNVMAGLPSGTLVGSRLVMVGRTRAVNVRPVLT